MFGYGGRFVFTGAIVITLIGSPDGAAPPPPPAVVPDPPDAVVTGAPPAVVSAAGAVPAASSSSSPHAASTIKGTTATEPTTRLLVRLVATGMHDVRMSLPPLLFVVSPLNTRLNRASAAQMSV